MFAFDGGIRRTDHWRLQPAGIPHMFQNLDWLPDNFVISGAVLSLIANSVILIVVVMVLRALTARLILRSVQPPALRGRSLADSRPGFLLLMLRGLVRIGGDALRALALSLGAVAVPSPVPATDLPLCIPGSTLTNASRSFGLGARIRVNGLRGFVTAWTLLATTSL